MKSKAKFKSDAFEAIHSAAQGLHRAGTIDKATMREFDESCLAAPSVIPPRRSNEFARGARGGLSPNTARFTASRPGDTVVHGEIMRG